MFKSMFLTAIALTPSVVGIPAVNSLGIPDNVLANETQLYPPYTYILPTDYIPGAQ